MAKSCITVCFTYSLRLAIFWTQIFAQGSVATCLGCGGVFVYDFVTNFLLSLTVIKFWKSVNIWWSFGQELGVLFFFDSRCRSYWRIAASTAATTAFYNALDWLVIRWPINSTTIAAAGMRNCLRRIRETAVTAVAVLSSRWRSEIEIVFFENCVINTQFTIPVSLNKSKSGG